MLIYNCLRRFSKCAETPVRGRHPARLWKNLSFNSSSRGLQRLISIFPELFFLVFHGPPGLGRELSEHIYSSDTVDVQTFKRNWDSESRQRAQKSAE